MSIYKKIEIIAEVVALWSVLFVGINLIFRPELEPVLWIKTIEVIVCAIVFVIFGSKILKEILEEVKGGKK